MAPADASSSTKSAQNSLKLDSETSEQKAQQPKLSGLEEDDEFEEFPVQGGCGPYARLLNNGCTDSSVIRACFSGRIRLG